jgi:hypothetical protein
VAARIETRWRSAALESVEDFALDETGDGWALRGSVTLPIDGDPARIEYEVLADQRWATRGATALVTRGDTTERLGLEVTEGGWRVNGVPRPDLARCIDLDLGWTPATNTLPINRLALDVGEAATIEAAWLRFPELTVAANRQTYTRLGESSWRYQSGPYDFVLETTSEGIVSRYGDDLWRADAEE